MNPVMTMADQETKNPVEHSNITPSTNEDDKEIVEPTTALEAEEEKEVVAPLLHTDDHDDNAYDSQHSMTFSLFVCWIIPLMFIAIFSRKLVDTSIPTINMVDQSPTQSPSTRPSSKVSYSSKKNTMKRSNDKPKRMLNTNQKQFPTQWPTSYRNELETIRRRRRPIEGFDGGIYSLLKLVGTTDVTKNVTQAPTTKRSVIVDTSGESKATPSTSPFRYGRSDPIRDRFHDQIQSFRKEHQRNPNDIYVAIALADTMRLYDMQFHEGGTYEQEAIRLYNEIIDMAFTLRKNAISAGKATDDCNAQDIQSVPDEVTLDYLSKSIDGLICSVYTSQGKAYFMANMFERAVEAYDGCLRGDIQQPYYLDALNSRASSLIVLGQYEEAGRDYLTVIQHDTKRLFIDSFTGMERILEAKEDVVPGGWDSVLSTVENLIESLEFQLKVEAQSKRTIAESLNRLYHFLFTYHDKKTKNYSVAFQHLTLGFHHKLSALPKWVAGSEKIKIDQTRNIFQRGFWSSETGSKTKTPIFIIGFVRSGSTLLERILDAHPIVAGTGENSVFNGRLGDIRDEIVRVSNTGGSIADLTRKLANEVVDEMQRRHAVLEANTKKAVDEIPKDRPKRLVDKMLTNYYNVGFIQLLYPKALILHVAREPMDSVFSAYKHEFPPGTLDYTSDYIGLSELYHTYRDIMDHWDDVLPGRITHIRYEDMVKDFEGTARAIIKAADLPWDDSVLQFHKKKHAVNTLSSTQVRKGVYTDSLKSWMRYEEQLQPLVKLIGDRVEFDFKTSLPGYESMNSYE
jgi:tetratricopeptide (TPR) repeat protein